jgi:hypothetical protein
MVPSPSGSTVRVSGRELAQRGITVDPQWLHDQHVDFYELTQFSWHRHPDMTEKHHPASSAGAQTRMERGQRREEKRKLVSEGKKQRKAFKEQTGFVRGAKVRKR